MAGGKLWTEQEDKFLEENYKQMPIEEIAEKLNRNHSGVQHRLSRLGYVRDKAQVGDEHNRLKIENIYMVEKYGQQISLCDCLCKCGKKTIGQKLTGIVQGTIKSCGCLKNEKAAERCKKLTYKHGKSKENNRLYRIWNGIKTRCYNINQASYKWYGQKGIKMCDEWLEDFQKFYDWSIENGYTDELTIDRIDSSKNYCPENCRWTSYREQALNRASTVRFKNIITAFGETKSADEWINDSRCVVKMNTLCHRIGSGWNPEIALTKPSQRCIKT